MKSLRVTVLYILDKTTKLLTTEPARLIGYGSAVIVALVAQFLAGRGYVRFEGITFEAALTLSVAAITIVITVVEAIRKFVYSPITFIETVSDEYHRGHEEAHIEEQVRAFIEAQMTPPPAPVAKRRVAVAPAPESDPDRLN